MSSNIIIRIDEECDRTFEIMAHEVAHIWFQGEHLWLDEGLANSVEYQVRENHPEEGPVYLPVTYCATYQNITELERANPVRLASNSASAFTCNYTLGDGIFQSLRQHLGTESFNQAVAQLAADSSAPRGSNVDDVRRVVGQDDKATELIDTWYSGQPKMRIFRHLNLVEYHSPPTLDGQYLHFAGRINEPGLMHEPILGHDNFCSQFHLHRGLDEPQPLEGPADPLPVGWKYDNIPDAVIINSEIDPASGEFSVTARVNRPHLLSSNDLSLRIASRATADQGGRCQESTIFSHVLVERGTIPDHLKKVKHYHMGQVTWDWPPRVNNYQIHLSGKAPPGGIRVDYHQEYCPQLVLYRLDESGYHWTSNVNPMLPAGSQWNSDPGAEIISGSVSHDGRFEAIIQIWDANLLNHPHVVLGVRAPSRADRSQNNCAPSDTMSAVTLQGK